MAFVTRFAPSPTGPLHLGHAYSAMLAHDMARAEGGTFLLRIEDIDRTRCRPEWEGQLKDDLNWLGIGWDAEPMRQSDRLADYGKALDDLWQRGLLYACTCTRRDIEAALSAPQEGVALPIGPDGPIYPGTCRSTITNQRDLPKRAPRPANANLRLHTDRVVAKPIFEATINAEGSSCNTYRETGIGPNGLPGLIAFSAKDIAMQVGDFVIARRDIGTSYHLSVVLDDAAQGITHVVRGADLTEATKIHVFLQNLIGFPTPIYHHHRLIRDDHGKRLAKRDDARALSKYRAEGATPADIRRMVGL